MQYKKIKSHGSSVFNYVNEFIIEQILFFGYNQQSKKRPGVNRNSKMYYQKQQCRWST